jgi:hypothetical protein
MRRRSISVGGKNGGLMTWVLAGAGLTLGAVLLKGTLKTVNKLSGNKIPAEFMSFRARPNYYMYDYDLSDQY